MSCVFRPSQHAFLYYIRLYHEASIRDLKFTEAHTFEKTDLQDQNFVENKEWVETFFLW